MARRGAAKESTETAHDDGAATPTLISPPESKTPPTATHKRHQSLSRNSEPVDASLLSKALKDFDQAGKARERTPIASPSRKRPRIQGDRFIPNRAGQDLQASFNLLHDDGSPATPSKSKRTPHNELHFQKNIYSLSPIKYSSQRMLLSPQRAPRAVSKVPYKVLDAPDLADDFYLNLVDWGSQNTLGVGLGSCVYMWNSSSGRVTKLCELQDDSVTSVNWIQRGSHIAIGTNKGQVQIWDAHTQRRLRTMMGHTARVGALAWNEHILTSGSRDRIIYHRDVRQPDQWLRKLVGHKQEICGLKWNHEDQQLASGGNDNKLMVWDKLNAEPTYKFSEHQAAVKAIAWSPHQRGLLASGGGTADRTIKFWNTLISSSGPSAASLAAASAAASASSSANVQTSPAAPANLLQSLDTGSQVCNLAWSKNSNEIVSTHGYSQNQIIVWKYPSMQQVVSLTGHTYRVLYLAMSPDGQVIVTGAGDETLRFWNAFKKKERTGGLSSMDTWGVIR
ncbi:substrate-specific activator of APC-dependent proteolysis [Didymella glomerata]|uniref:Substrate-specific activator of APC-dependent proteolysis n=1 Tax=Didymella glomerata TaxID=749621 RepID=A0A9W8X8G3_9PLEO|nr:substrate-specific activator of APC-dependent proteolysis [Didymella glomerata]